MGRRKLVMQVFFFAALLPALLILFAAAWYGASYAKSAYMQSVREHLAINAKLVEAPITELVKTRDLLKLEALCRELEAKAGIRITVIDAKGAVLADSHEDPLRMGDHSTRPEIQEALSGNTSYATRYSSTLDRNMLYMAMPVRLEPASPYVLRASMSLKAVTDVLSSVYAHILFAVFALVILAGILSFLVARKISRPVEDIKNGAKKISDGNLALRLPLPETEELAELAETLNSMAAQLQQRLGELTRERNEREAILSSMAEGLFAVDANARIIKVNNAATELLRLPRACEGLMLHEAVRNTAFHNFVEQMLRDGKANDCELVFYDEEQRYVKAHGAVLGDKSGAVVVLNDVSRLRQLEEMRRDFVANVSHEIKTPLTAIRAAVETLQDGAMDSREDAARFMTIITKHTDRLSALVEDILSLSNLEREALRKEISLADAPLDALLSTAADLCKEKAEARQIRIQVSCASGLKIFCDRALLEQAILNLIDNAIKYSNDCGLIEIVGKRNGQQTTITVKDSGCGIPREHLPRLFERFYRVDKARSRKLGGTGLGLAIVKHIVQTHSGTVSVESEIGKGSIFTITIPESLQK